MQVKVGWGQVQSWCSVPMPHRTTASSRRPPAPAARTLPGAAEP